MINTYIRLFEKKPYLFRLSNSILHALNPDDSGSLIVIRDVDHDVGLLLDLVNC